MSENYYMTNFDLLLFAKHFKIPMVLLSSLRLKENDKSFLIVNKNIAENYYFILVQPVKKDEIPQYRLFSYKSVLQINIKQINFPMQTDIKISSEFNLDTYIKTFKVKKITLMPPKKQSQKIIKEESEDEDLDELELINALERLDEENDTPLIPRPASK